MFLGVFGRYFALAEAFCGKIHPAASAVLQNNIVLTAVFRAVFNRKYSKRKSRNVLKVLLIVFVFRNIIHSQFPRRISYGKATNVTKTYPLSRRFSSEISTTIRRTSFNTIFTNPSAGPRYR